MMDEGRGTQDQTVGIDLRNEYLVPLLWVQGSRVHVWLDPGSGVGQIWFSNSKTEIRDGDGDVG